MEQATPTIAPKKNRSKFWIKWRDALIHFLCIAPLLAVIVLIGSFVDNGFSERRVLTIVVSVIVCTIITFVIPQIMMTVKDYKNKKIQKETKAVI